MVRNNSIRLSLLLIVLLFLFSIGAAQRDLTFPDELRYAEVSREMMEHRSWFLPTFNFETYHDKPPLFFWLVALSMKGLGTHPFSALLPSFLSSLLTIVATYLLGKELFNRQVGITSAWVLSTSLFFLIVSQFVRMDITLTMLITFALYFFTRVLKNQGKHRRYLLSGYFCIALALLTKGPVGIILPVIIIASYLTITGQLEAGKILFSMQGFLLLVAIPLLWLIPAGLEGGESYLKEILWTQGAKRAVESQGHPQPFYYYMFYLPFLCAPWTFSLLLYLDPIIRKDLSRDRKEHIFLGCWIISTVLFFSLISGKIVLYILPIMPAFALLVGRLNSPLLENPKILQKPLLFKSMAYLLSAGCLAGALSLLVFRHRAEYLTDWQHSLPTFVILLITGALLFYQGSRMQIKNLFIVTGMITLLVVMTITLWVLPRINPYLSLKPMAQRILMVRKHDPTVGGFRVDMGKYLTFYTQSHYHELRSEDDLQKFVQKEQVFLITKQEDLPSVKEMVQRNFVELGRFQIKKKAYSLLMTKDR